MKRMKGHSGLWRDHPIMLAVGLCLFVVGAHPAWAATVATAGGGSATASLAQIAKELAPAKPFFVTSDGKWIAPLMYIGSFALLANGLMHLDPARKKASEFGVGIITVTADIMWWPFLIAMMASQGLGPLTNLVTGLAGMYAFFFTVLGLTQIFHVESRHQLGAVAIFIGWLTGVYAYFFLTTPAPTGGTWVYHFTIALVWFVAMNLAGLYMQGRMKERVLGWVVSFAAIYTFAVPAVLWSMPPGHQGPF
ncbi:hypothetical protein [Acidiferrobacter sp.]|uniref:hypothetical protein n=1 Tax=Acidiferrobacter sp. TaxID=1872107 RepID=UPI0026240510|nr:hypothetical protein [Acidiferrobacter sp.]